MKKNQFCLLIAFPAFILAFSAQAHSEKEQMTGEGHFSPIEMGGMFTILKSRANQKVNDNTDPGWYDYPAGTVAYEVNPS